MFRFVRFLVYAMRMRRSYYAATRAKDEESTFQFLRKARQFGLAALQIQSPFIPQQVRAAMKKNLVAVHGLYQRGLIARMPEEDLELVVFIFKLLKSWSDMNIIPNARQVESAIQIFETAKFHLNSGANLGMIYGGERALMPLRNIMQPFFAGEATREETEKRLDECAGKLRKWLPEMILFFEKSPSQ